MRRALVITALALLAPATATAAKKRQPLVHEGLGGGWFFVLPVKAQLGAGWVHGASYRDVSGAGLLLGVAARPEIRLRTTKVRAALELDYRARETLGWSLAERRFESSLLLSGRLGAGFALQGRGTFLMVSRPDWADYYQDLAETDRYSRLEGVGEATAGWRASPTLELEVFGGLARRRYRIDPAYDPILTPTHVAPFSSSAGFGGARASGRAFAVYGWLAELGVESIRFDQLYSRDAVTASTHSGPGGPPPNPLQRFVRIRARERNRIWIAALRTHLRLELVYRRNVDTFQGYYSWNEGAAELSLRVRPFGGLALEAGYRIGGRLHATSASDRRAWFQRAEVRIEYALWRRRLFPFLEGEYRSFRTNFPDYPLIDFDYENQTVVAGIELRI